MLVHFLPGRGGIVGVCYRHLSTLIASSPIQSGRIPAHVGGTEYGLGGRRGTRNHIRQERDQTSSRRWVRHQVQELAVQSVPGQPVLPPSGAGAVAFALHQAPLDLVFVLIIDAPAAAGGTTGLFGLFSALLLLEHPLAVARFAL